MRQLRLSTLAQCGAQASLRPLPAAMWPVPRAGRDIHAMCRPTMGAMVRGPQKEHRDGGSHAVMLLTWLGMPLPRNSLNRVLTSRVPHLLPLP